MRSLLLVASVLSLAACGVSNASVTDDQLAEYEQKLSSNSCQTHCQKCPPNRICILSCQLVGNCGTRCNSLALCVEGYHWDETACACLPDGGGQKCGKSHCGAGQVCCNDSCGICTEPGGFCIQLFCSPTDGDTTTL